MYVRKRTVLQSKFMWFENKNFLASKISRYRYKGFLISLTRTTNAVRSCSERKGREKVISGLCELHMRNSFGHMRNSFISGKSCLYEYSEGEMKFHFGLLVVLLLYCSCIVKILKFIYIIEDIYSRMSKLDSHRIDSSDHDGY